MRFPSAAVYPLAFRFASLYPIQSEYTSNRPQPNFLTPAAFNDRSKLARVFSNPYWNFIFAWCSVIDDRNTSASERLANFLPVRRHCKN
jgi:hypothetical protein